jgi:hypothetical protein
MSGTLGPLFNVLLHFTTERETAYLYLLSKHLLIKHEGISLYITLFVCFIFTHLFMIHLAETKGIELIYNKI